MVPKVVVKSNRLEGFKDHCNVLYILLNSIEELNPAFKHHIRSAVREASNKIGGRQGNKNKNIAHYMSENARKQMINGVFVGLVGEHIIPVSLINSKIIESVFGNLTD